MVLLLILTKLFNILKCLSFNCWLCFIKIIWTRRRFVEGDVVLNNYQCKKALRRRLEAATRFSFLGESVTITLLTWRQFFPLPIWILIIHLPHIFGSHLKVCPLNQAGARHWSPIFCHILHLSSSLQCWHQSKYNNGNPLQCSRSRILGWWAWCGRHLWGLLEVGYE